ncbi:MAG: extracellular solute-binding protein [Gammaproteobacteria bacterium]|nr:MAG: extracellular solute-binding protein [Gammaproteobacteria bacterium]
MRWPALAMLLLLAGCGGGTEQDVRVLRVYNWSDYIAPDTVPRFEAETGIRVSYDVFDSNEVLEAKLLTGASGYDLVVPTSDFMGRQILAGVFQPLDKSQLPNLRNLDPELMRLIENFDPGNRYGVPYLWGTTGFGYNSAAVRSALGPDAPLDSLDLLFQPRYLSHLADCGVAFLDAPQEVFSAVLNYLGQDPNSNDLSLYRGPARELLLRIRPYIRYFHSSQYINDLANGEICIAFGWSGDVLQAAARAREAGNGIDIRYTIPREGALLWIDMLAIPADARHPDNAHRFIDYLLRPEVIAAVTRHVKYANANLAANALLPPEILGNPGIYPPEELRARLWTDKVTPPKVDRVMNRIWTEVKTGR